MKPLGIFVGLAVATLGGIVALTHDRWADRGQIGTTLEALPVNIKARQPKLFAHNEGKAGQTGQVEAPAASATAAPPATGTEGEGKAADAGAPEAMTAEPAAPQAPAGDAAGPTFDIVRVEPDGGAVIAGRAKPDADVVVRLDDQVLGEARSNSRGEWLMVPEAGLARGTHELTVAEKGEPAGRPAGRQRVVMTLPGAGTGAAPLIVLSEPGKPTRVLQQPEPEPQQTVAAATEAAGAPERTGDAEPAGTEVAAAAPPTSGSETGAAAADQPPATGLGSPLALALSAVDYNDGGDILFSGRATPGSTVRIYVDNRHAGDATADAGGYWLYRGEQDVSAGQHVLRADQLRPDGSVAARIELPFFRADPRRVAELVGSRSRASDAAAPAGSGEAAAGSAGPAQTGPVASQELGEQTVAEAAASPAGPAAGSTAVPTEATVSGAGRQVAAAPAASEPAVPEPATAAPPATPGKPAAGRIVIQPGNNLWNISRVVYGRGIEYTVIYEANKDRIRNPHWIYPGQIFTTPGVSPPEEIDPRRRQPLSATETGGPGAQAQ